MTIIFGKAWALAIVCPSIIVGFILTMLFLESVVEKKGLPILRRDRWTRKLALSRRPVKLPDALKNGLSVLVGTAIAFLIALAIARLQDDVKERVISILTIVGVLLAIGSFIFSAWVGRSK